MKKSEQSNRLSVPMFFSLLERKETPWSKDTSRPSRGLRHLATPLCWLAVPSPMDPFRKDLSGYPHALLGRTLSNVFCEMVT